MSEWKSIAKVGPMDVIRSQTTNDIIDNLEWLHARTPAPCIIGSSYDMLEILAGTYYARKISLLPFYDGYSDEDPSIPKGLPLPFKAKLSNLMIAVKENTLDVDVDATLYVEGEPTSLKVTLTKGEAGIFSDTLNETTVEQGKRIYVVIDLSGASTGNLILDGWTIKAILEV